MSKWQVYYIPFDGRDDVIKWASTVITGRYKIQSMDFNFKTEKFRYSEWQRHLPKFRNCVTVKLKDNKDALLFGLRFGHLFTKGEDDDYRT